MNYEHFVAVYQVELDAKGEVIRATQIGTKWVALDTEPPVGFQYVSPSQRDLDAAGVVCGIRRV